MTNAICGIDFKRRLGRGATSDGSRGFQPTDGGALFLPRRGATRDGRGVVGFKRRSATRNVLVDDDRGLKPTATTTGCLRGRASRGAADDGSRAFQRPDKRTNGDARRVAAVELADLNQEAGGLAKTIQKNFERLGV